jgi:hypothetical protein
MIRSVWERQEKRLTNFRGVEIHVHALSERLCNELYEYDDLRQDGEVQAVQYVFGKLSLKGIFEKFGERIERDLDNSENT